MADARCPSCSKTLLPGAPLGLCPECLIKSGFQTGTAPASSGGRGFPPPAVDHLRPLFPQLEILELVGQGGMGAVYKARQPGLNRLVALKILPPAISGDAGFADRFTREARLLARLQHPRIVAIHDVGVAGNLHYLLMEYVDGPNLRQVQRTGRLAPEQALRIVPEICEALQFAHDRGVVHRDIKPENVLLDRDGHVKITDFGIAKMIGPDADTVGLTGSVDVIGTPHYMAPEQIERPLDVDHRADIYSLGVVFYELLTGELPLGRFAAPSQRVQVDVRLDDVVLRALEKEPARRYQQVSDVKTRLDTIAGSAPTRVQGGAARHKRINSIVPILLYIAQAVLLWVVYGSVLGGLFRFRAELDIAGAPRARSPSPSRLRNSNGSCGSCSPFWRSRWRTRRGASSTTPAGRRCPSDIGGQRRGWRRDCCSSRCSTSTGPSSASTGLHPDSRHGARSIPIGRSSQRETWRSRRRRRSSPPGPSDCYQYSRLSSPSWTSCCSRSITAPLRTTRMR